MDRDAQGSNGLGEFLSRPYLGLAFVLFVGGIYTVNKAKS